MEPLLKRPLAIGFASLIILNIIGTIYYTLLLYNFSWFGIFVTVCLTIAPFLGGIYFYLCIEAIMKDKKDKASRAPSLNDVACRKKW